MSALTYAWTPCIRFCLLLSDLNLELGLQHAKIYEQMKFSDLADFMRFSLFFLMNQSTVDWLYFWGLRAIIRRRYTYFLSIPFLLSVSSEIISDSFLFLWSNISSCEIYAMRNNSVVFRSTTPAGSFFSTSGWYIFFFVCGSFSSL